MGIKFVLDIIYEGSSIGAAGLYDDSRLGESRPCLIIQPVLLPAVRAVATAADERKNRREF
jgi:hypothetical protein